MYNFSVDDIFSIKSNNQFNEIALKIFNYQAENNPIYKKYLFHLGTKRSEINNLNQIPFLPIEFFKTHNIITGTKESEKTFFSSGTTGTVRSNHHITDISIY